MTGQLEFIWANISAVHVSEIAETKPYPTENVGSVQ